MARQFAELVRRYCSEVRSSREPFQLEVFQGIVQEATVDIGRRSPRPLDDLTALLGQLTQDLGSTLSVAMDADEVVTSRSPSLIQWAVLKKMGVGTFEAPWIARVAMLRSSAAVSVDAERKVMQLNEEIRNLVRDNRAKVGPRYSPPYGPGLNESDRTPRSKRAGSRSSSWRSGWRRSRSRWTPCPSSSRSWRGPRSRRRRTRRRWRPYRTTSTAWSRRTASSSNKLGRPRLRKVARACRLPAGTASGRSTMSLTRATWKRPSSSSR